MFAPLLIWILSGSYYISQPAGLYTFDYPSTLLTLCGTIGQFSIPCSILLLADYLHCRPLQMYFLPNILFLPRKMSARKDFRNLKFLELSANLFAWLEFKGEVLHIIPLHYQFSNPSTGVGPDFRHFFSISGIWPER